MAGHIQDRWYQPKRDADGEIVRDEKGKVVRERSPLYKKGLRYKVRYYDPQGNEKSESFPDKQLKKAQDFLTKQRHDVLAGVYVDPDAGKDLFEKYTREVLMGRSKDKSSVSNRDWMLKTHILPHLGRVPVGRFTTTVIRNWLGGMDTARRRPADTYQRQMFDLVSSILDAAVADGKLRKNPCKDKSIVAPSDKSVPVRVWPVTRMRAIELVLPA